MKLFTSFFVCLLAFVVIDLVWINLAVIDAYRQYVDGWILDQPRMGAAIGFYFLYVGGLVALAVWPTLLGAAVSILGKLWFIDRMVWLYEDMKDADAEYRSWLYGQDESD